MLSGIQMIHRLVEVLKGQSNGKTYMFTKFGFVSIALNLISILSVLEKIIT